MNFLNVAELAQLRNDLETLLPDVCHIMRRTQTNDHGHVVDTLGTAVANAACRIDPITRSDNLGIIASQEKGTNFWQVTLPHDTDIRDGDEIVFEGKTYRLVQIHDEHSAKACKRAIAARKG